MSQEPPALGHLDALFASIRAFAQELDASRRWLARAEQTENQAWRLSFLREARTSFERAPARLSTIADRLHAFGRAGEIPAPLDRIQDNLATMRADVEAQGAKIADLEARMAQAAAPIGSA